MKKYFFVIFFLLIGCSTTKEVIKRETVVFDLARNTKREDITNEVIAILQLNNFLIEINDSQTNKRTIQTSWRVEEFKIDSINEVIQIRDRAFLNIEPRGKSSVYVNVYPMVNSEIEFEVEQKSTNDPQWKKIPPTAQMEKLYKGVVRDIRNRMLRYGTEF